MTKISVVIPIYNRENFIEETLISVEKQKLFPFEVIIIDDGSTDNSIKVVTDYAKNSKLNIIIFKNEFKKGQSGATNYGIEKSSGEFIALLDSDDLWTPSHLEQLFNALNANSDVAIAFSQVEVFGNAKDALQQSEGFKKMIALALSSCFSQISDNVWLSNKDLTAFLLEFGVPFRCPASMIKKDFFYKNNLFFDTDMTYTLDSLFLTLASYYSKFIYVTQTGFKLRRHQENDGNIGYGEKIPKSFELRVKKLKEFFINKELTNQEQIKLKLSMLNLTAQAIAIRVKKTNLLVRISKSIKLVFKFPNIEAVKKTVKIILNKDL